MAGLALVLAGCGGNGRGDVNAAPTGGSQTDVVGDYVADDLPAPFAAGDSLRVTFKDGQIGFQATCNSFSGPATWQVGGTLDAANFGGTEMGCPGDGFAQDEWLVDFFGSSPQMTQDGDAIVLTGAGATIRLLPQRLARPDKPLEGTLWVLTGIEETSGDTVGFTPVPQGVEATLTFEQGQAGAVDGCNSGGGPVRIEPDSLVIGELVWTLKACGGAESQVASRVQEVLQKGEVPYAVEHTRLTVGDRVRLVYEARDR